MSTSADATRNAATTRPDIHSVAMTATRSPFNADCVALRVSATINGQPLEAAGLVAMDTETAVRFLRDGDIDTAFTRIRDARCLSIGCLDALDAMLPYRWHLQIAVLEAKTVLLEAEATALATELHDTRAALIEFRQSLAGGRTPSGRGGVPAWDI